MNHPPQNESLPNVMTISFSEGYHLSERAIRLVKGVVGLYFVYLDEQAITYPFHSSRLIYIGLSESKQNSIGNRLRGHLIGQSGNLGIKNYAQSYATKFTFHSFELLQTLGTRSLFELEDYFLTNFQDNFGAFPICNGQSGVKVTTPFLDANRSRVLWEFFGLKNVATSA
jgi:hypothetical protein